MNSVGDGSQQRVRRVSVDRATVSPVEMPTHPHDGQGGRLARQNTTPYSNMPIRLFGDFDDLKSGEDVYYNEDVGDTGPIATKVPREEQEPGHGVARSQ
jgi:hypothetical protein